MVPSDGRNPLLLDAADFYKNPELSDVTIIIREDLSDGSAEHMEMDSAGPSDGVNETRIPGHKIIFAASSELFKTKLARWTGENELEVLVPRSQLCIGELLIQCLYQPQPQLSGCSQPQLMHLLQLADKHDVKKAVYAAGSALKSIPTDRLEWGTAMAIFSLPPGCPELEAYKPIFKAATARVVQELGDLEVDWQDPQKQQLLLSLPFAAMLALLQDSSTRVASENTVAYTIQAWAHFQRKVHREQAKQQQQLQNQQQDQQQDFPTREQLQRLVEQIRMQHCTQLYISTIMTHMPDVAPCFDTAEWLCACALAQRSTGNPSCNCFVAVTRPSVGACDNCGISVNQTEEGRLLAGLHPYVQAHPSWGYEARPRSSINHLHVSWKVNMDELAATVDGMLGSMLSSHEWIKVTSPTVVWAGLAMNMLLYTGTCRKRAASVTGYTGHFYFAAMLQDEAGPTAVCTFDVRGMVALRPTAGDNAADLTAELSSLRTDRLMVRARFTHAFQDVFGIGEVTDGLDAQRKMRALNLVQQDNHVHLTLQLTNPVM